MLLGLGVAARPPGRSVPTPAQALAPASCRLRCRSRRRRPQPAPAPPRAAGSRSRIPRLRRARHHTAFDANQRALIDRVNIYLMSVQTLVGDFVQVGPDGRRSEGKI